MHDSTFFFVETDTAISFYLKSDFLKKLFKQIAYKQFTLIIS